MVRVFAKSREGKSSIVDEFALHEIIRGRRGGAKKILERITIIASTCLATYIIKECNIEFDLVIVNDAHSASIPECLLPIALGKTHIVLLGDPNDAKEKEKTPEKEEKKENPGSMDLFSNLFIRLFNDVKFPAIYLSRIPKFIGEVLPAIGSNIPIDYYERCLDNYIKLNPLQLQPLIFIHVDGQEELLQDSYQNDIEAKLTAEILQKLILGGANLSALAAITPYDNQKNLIMDKIQTIEELKSVIVHSFDTVYAGEYVLNFLIKYV